MFIQCLFIHSYIHSHIYLFNHVPVDWLCQSWPRNSFGVVVLHTAAAFRAWRARSKINGLQNNKKIRIMCDGRERSKLVFFLVACTRLYNSLCPSVGLSVGLSLFIFYDFIFRPRCPYSNGLVTSNMAPVHPHATSVAVYPALFFCGEKGITDHAHAHRLTAPY